MNKNLSKKEKIQLKRQEKQREKQQEEERIKKIQPKLPPVHKGQTKPKSNQKQVVEGSSNNQISQNKSKNNSNNQLNKKKKKKVIKEAPPQEDQNDASSEDQQENLDFNNVMEDQENLQFSFLIAEINEKHYHSMKTILQKFARLTGIMSSEWADAIVNNAKAGNVVVADDAEEEEQDDDQQQESQEEDDEDNVCSGVVNILPNSHKLSKKLVTKIWQSVQNKQPKYHGSKKPSQLLAKNSCSLLICERAINLPAAIVKSMHEVLVDDLKQLGTQNNQEYLKVCGANMLGLSQVEIPKGAKTGQVTVEDIIFSKFEDYLFLQKSECWWIGEGSPNSLRKAPLHKLYYVISTDNYFQAVAQIQTLLDE